MQRDLQTKRCRTDLSALCHCSYQQFVDICMRVQNLEILSLVRRELQREGFIKVLKVHIHPSCASGDMPRLQRIITQLGSEVMPSESKPSACPSLLHPGHA